MKSIVPGTILLASLLVGCSSSPLSPESPTISLALPLEVTGAIVPCDTCESPTASAVATTEIILSNRGSSSHRVVTVDTIVVNQTRRTVLASNRRPNADVVYAESEVPPGGSLTLEAGVVYPMPPPRDDIQFLVVVTISDGTKVQQQARLITAGA